MFASPSVQVRKNKVIKWYDVRVWSVIFLLIPESFKLAYHFKSAMTLISRENIFFVHLVFSATNLSEQDNGWKLYGTQVFRFGFFKENRL
jgi:hypothetical protein